MSSTTIVPNVRNVTRVFRAATDAQRDAGLNWYADALKISEAYGAAYGVTTRQAAGVIAALSPLNSWGANLSLAARFLEAGGLSAGYLGVGLRKANLILAGKDPESLLTSLKVGAFFQCIVTGGQTDAVCVDRHAFSIAHYSRTVHVPSLTATRYNAIADTYRNAARILSKTQGQAVSAPEVQAVTWVAWRERFWAAGAFDPKAS
jgi:hypothetical protein